MRLVTLPVIAALLSGAASLALAMHHPLAPLGIAGLVLGCWVVSFVWPRWWILALPAALPIIGLAPWTGWITFEELDILILAIAGGGYMHLAWDRRQGGRNATFHEYSQGHAVLSSLILAMFALSTAIAMFRGFGDAGGFRIDWFQGYHESMNSVRLAKSLFEVLLIMPLWRLAYRQDAEGSQKLFAAGLVLGLTAVSLVTIWERLAFSALLDFSDDYRTTGPFWEMHVGGAALDGYFALTVPFAVRELLAARTPVRWGLASIVCALAAYACLTTFSRGVYLAIPVGLTVLFVLQSRQHSQPMQSNAAKSAQMGGGAKLVSGMLLVAGFSASAAWMFQTSGYRGVGAMLGATALLLPLAGGLRMLRTRQWIAGGVGGAMLASVAAAIAWLLPKGAYIAYGAGFAFTALMIFSQYKRAASIRTTGPLALAGLVATVTGMVLVSNHWGYAAAVVPAAVSAVGFLSLAVAAGTARRPLWPDVLRWQAGVVSLLFLAFAVVAVFGGGAYMGDRFATTASHLDFRLAHWKLGTFDCLWKRHRWRSNADKRASFRFVGSNHRLVSGP